VDGHPGGEAGRLFPFLQKGKGIMATDPIDQVLREMDEIAAPEMLPPSCG
jgi:hypothetical protein